MLCSLQADQEWASVADYMLWKVFQFPCHPSAGRSETLTPLLVVTELVRLLCSACFTALLPPAITFTYHSTATCLLTILSSTVEMMVADVQMVERLSLSQLRTGRTLPLCGARTCGLLNIFSCWTSQCCISCLSSAILNSKVAFSLMQRMC